MSNEAFVRSFLAFFSLGWSVQLGFNFSGLWQTAHDYNFVSIISLAFVAALAWGREGNVRRDE